MDMRTPTPIGAAVVVPVLLVVSMIGCAANDRSRANNPDPIALVESFRAASDRGDLDAARAYLADDPRVWYEKREGEGLAWTLGAGRWKAWDEHFESVSTPGPWHAEGDTVWRINEEWNEYYDLIERTDRPRYRLTYFLEEDAGGRRRIKGYMISAADPDAPPPDPGVRRDRADEIEAWAEANEPDEWAYLRPGGKIDPTGDRAARTRALINRWRGSVGLDPIE